MKTKIFILSLVTSLFLTGCVEEEFQDDFEVSIPREVSREDGIKVGQIITLSSNAVETIGTNEWISSNPEIVKVEGNKAYGLKTGSVTITATRTVNNQTFDSSFQLNVVERELEFLQESTNLLKTGDDSELLFVVRNSSKDTISTSSVSLTSANPTIVGIKDGEIISGLNVGTTTVRAEITNASNNEKHFYDFDITVEQFVSTFKINLTSTNIIGLNTTNDINFEITNQRNQTFSSSNTTISSNNTSVISINNGKLVANGLGKADITITANVNNNTVTETFTYIVSGFKVNNTTTQNTIDVSQGNLPLTFEIVDENNTIRTPDTVSWKSSNSNIASIENGNELSPKSNGSVTVTLKTSIDGENFELEYNYTITKYKVTLRSNTTLESNSAFSINATVWNGPNITLGSGNNNNDITLTWSSSNSGIFDVIGGSTVVGRSAGNATLKLTAVINNVTINQEFSLTVVEPAPQIFSGTLEGAPGYSASGSFEIFKDNSGQYILKLINYRVGGIRWAVYLSNTQNAGGNAIQVENGIPRSGTGQWAIPSDIDPSDYSFVIVNCEAINAAVAIGQIQ